MEIVCRSVKTDMGELNAMIFTNTCPVCGSEYEYGMVNIHEPSGYYPITANGSQIWEPGYSEDYKVDITTHVFGDYSQSHPYCVWCGILLRSAAQQQRNTQNSTMRRKARKEEARSLQPDPICKYCQQPFKSKRSDALYCSDKCRQQAHRKGVQKSSV